MNNDVKITEIEIIPIKPKDGLIGFASFVLDDKYYVNSVAIRTRLNSSSYRLVYPSKKVGEKNINIFHPIDSITGRVIEEAVSEKVNDLFNNVSDEKHEQLSRRLYR